jgi:hypothetical protein
MYIGLTAPMTCCLRALSVARYSRNIARLSQCVRWRMEIWAAVAPGGMTVAVPGLTGVMNATTESHLTPAVSQTKQSDQVREETGQTSDGGQIGEDPELISSWDLPTNRAAPRSPIKSEESEEAESPTRRRGAGLARDKRAPRARVSADGREAIPRVF